MAKINTIKTRILNMYDLLTNYTNSFVPLKGEICLVEIPSGSSETGLTPPTVGIKVGDGSTTFDKLQWLQAIAGDVSSFVKSIKDNEDFATKISNAIGYDNKINIQEIISAINTKFESYSTTTEINTIINEAKNALKGQSSDVSSDETIAGAKKHADEIGNNIEDNISKMSYSAADDSGAIFGITQENGKITSTIRRKIKKADFDSNDVFVFYCGGAGKTYPEIIIEDDDLI